MPEIALPKYLQYINSLIDDSRLAEAVAHSRHLLEQHPRCVDAYRALGKALLEQGDYAGAVDVFHRVLSAVPDDFIAHVGLAIVHKAGNREKQALWHMERAFEVEPYNPAIRAELQDLYGRRDGLAPEQPELTRGALARLYVKSGLYQQATLELRDLLAADPERVDLRLLLAEALWRAEERVEAADVCRDVLELLPDSLQANAILADILLQTGEAETAAAYLQRVQDLTQLSAATLDPATTYAQSFSLPGAVSVPREIWVDRLSDEAALGMGERAEAAAWMNELDLEAAEAEEDLDWLRELQEAGEEFLPPEPEEERLNWLQDVSAAEEEPEEVSGAILPPEKAAEAASDWAESVEDEEIDWTARTNETGDLPAWLGADADDLSFLDEPVEASTPDWLEEQPESSDAATGIGSPDDETVLEDLAMDVHGNAADELPDEEEQEAGAEELDWLDELSAAGEVAGEPEQPEWVEDEIPTDNRAELEWLAADGDMPTYERLDAESPGPAEETVSSWLSGDSGDLDTSGEDLSWLDQIAGGQAEPPEEMPTLEWPEDESLPELADEPADVEPFVDAEPSAHADVTDEEPDEPIEGEGLDWLDAIASEGAGTDDAWLDDLAVDIEGEEAAESSSEPRLFTDDISGIDWLDELGTEPDSEGVGPDEEEPADWLDEAESAGVEEGKPGTWVADDEGEVTVAEQAVEATVFMWGDEEDAEGEPGPDAETEFAAPVSDEGTVEEAFTWLDELDAEGEDVDATGRFAADDEAEVTVEEPGWLIAEPMDGAEEEEADLDWLDAVIDERETVEADEQDEQDEALDALSAKEERVEEPKAALQLDDDEGDLEEAMAWLNEVPEGVAVETEEAVPQDLEEAMAWLDDRPDQEDEKGEFGEVPEDLDEAMAWLEQLAAQQGAPLEELPSVGDAEPEAGRESEEAIEAPEAAEIEPALNLEWMETLAETDEPLEAEGVDSALADEGFDVPEDLDEAMAWLERLAAQQGAPLEELPSVQADEDYAFEAELGEDEFESDEDETFALEEGEGTDIAFEEVPDELEEAMVWLDELAAEQHATAAEEPAPIIDELEAPAELSEEALAEAERDEEPEPGYPDDEDETPESMTVPDVAMMYLDSLVERGGGFGDEDATIGEEEPVEVLAAAIPDDPAAALAWLEQLASGIEPEVDTAGSAAPDVAVEEEAAVFAETEPTAFAGQDEFGEFDADLDLDVDAVPEDPDEVMAWLERLAARQGASLDELPSVDEVSDEIETPDWLFAEIEEAETTGYAIEAPDIPVEREQAAVEPLSLEEAVEPDADEFADEASWLDEETGLEWIDAVTSEEPSEGLEWLEQSGAVEEGSEALEEPALSVLDDELDDLMPDWLTMDEESWEEPELGITSWLVAEEELSQVGMATPPPPAAAPVETEPVAEPEQEPAVVYHRSEPPDDMDANQLEEARAALDAGEMDSALDIYQELLEAGAGLNVIIGDLELAADAGYKPVLCRVLGDAYMQNGQLNRALEVYRKALDLL